jgi:hypothetical protein
MTDLLQTEMCATCQAPTPTLPPPLSWSPAIDDGRRVWTCPACARDNIRNIESRVDPAWW